MAKSKVPRAKATKTQALRALRKWARVQAQTRQRKAAKATAPPMDAQSTKDTVSLIHDDLFAEENALRCIYLALESVPEVGMNADLTAAQDLLRNSTERINGIAQRLDALWLTLPKPKEAKP